MQGTVQILMSTYNGERFLHEQLSSIYSQEGVDIKLTVRDDGSTDATRRILEEESAAGRLQWYTGANKGPAWSFWDLVLNAPDTEFYAFADQDDVWDSNKLKAALEYIGDKGNEPALYFCQTRLVDSQLREIPNVTISPLLTYGEALMYQFVGGCTMVFNHALRKLLKRYTPTYIRMHDVWIYDVALAVGAHVSFDRRPHMSYRQHGDNAVGQMKSLKFVWSNRYKRLRKNEHIRSRLAKELLTGYGDIMSKYNRELTELVAGYRNSSGKWVKLFLSPRLKCASSSVAITGRMAILTRMF